MHIEKKYRINGRHKISLAELSTKPEIETDEKEIKEEIEKDIKKLSENQEMLYAQDKKGILILFQAMDAAGKDSMIEHVMKGINPQGCSVASFKSPSQLELDHDYLWRVHAEMPRRGEIGIFNRSYYEDVLITRVHPEILLNSRLPNVETVEDVTEKIFQKRYKDIKHFEKYLTNEGFTIIKFFLHLSKEEQKNRFIRRIEIPEKNWKFSLSDAKERAFWDDYQDAYEKAINATATKKNPWYVIPADNKWYSRYLVSSIINERVKELDLAFPTVDEERKQELQEILKVLKSEK